MSALRSLALDLWDEWGPAYRKGRLDLGPIVIRVQTRKQIQREVWDNMLLGTKIEQRAPGAVAARVGSLSAESIAPVRHLALVQR